MPKMQDKALAEGKMKTREEELKEDMKLITKELPNGSYSVNYSKLQLNHMKSLLNIRELKGIAEGRRLQKIEDDTPVLESISKKLFLMYEQGYAKALADVEKIIDEIDKGLVIAGHNPLKILKRKIKELNNGNM